MSEKGEEYRSKMRKIENLSQPEPAILIVNSIERNGDTTRGSGRNGERKERE